MTKGPAVPLPVRRDERLPPPVHRQVLMVVHDPALRRSAAPSVRHHFRWRDPEELAEGYIDDVRECSFGYAEYGIVERVLVDDFPRKADGFRYDEDTYLAAWRRRSFHQPDTIDYHRLVDDLDLLERVASGGVDEVWLFGHPYSGYYESVMAGPGAFWCNGPPIGRTGGARRRFVIMGFSFERGVGEMLEDLGHRAEAILARVFASTAGEANLWQRFTRYDRRHPGRAECGTVHYAPNSARDYDWGNRRAVPSRCDAWLRFPDLSGEPRLVDCRDWGGGDIREHHRWWLRHMPHTAGETAGVSHNWWEYIVDPNRVP